MTLIDQKAGRIVLSFPTSETFHIQTFEKEGMDFHQSWVGGKSIRTRLPLMDSVGSKSALSCFGHK